jgi:hypothetical protein
LVPGPPPSAIVPAFGSLPATASIAGRPPARPPGPQGNNGERDDQGPGASQKTVKSQEPIQNPPPTPRFRRGLPPEAFYLL